MKAKKEASGKRISLGKTRKTYVSPKSVYPIELHDRARVGRCDKGGRLGVLATI
jgi:hypothetical protein